MRTIIVGDEPSPKMKKGAAPFEGAACHSRLLEWIKVMNVGAYTLYNRADLDFKSVLFGKLDKADVKFIALGNKASVHLTASGIPHFKLPHPSGLNRQINNKKFISQQLELAKKFLVGAKPVAEFSIYCKSYEGTKKSLESFYNKLEDGAIIIKYYNDSKHPQVSKAVTEFIKGKFLVLESTMGEPEARLSRVM